MKHKHYDMIVAKAANMELVVFAKLDGAWYQPTNSDLQFFDNGHDKYFLCLPQHKEACLHWLNGGKVESLHKDYEPMELAESGVIEWGVKSTFMKNSIEIRIAPKKEKRWIGYCASRNQTIPHPQDSEQLAMDYTALHYSYHVNEWRFIEIEVEV